MALWIIGTSQCRAEKFSADLPDQRYRIRHVVLLGRSAGTSGGRILRTAVDSVMAAIIALAQGMSQSVLGAEVLQVQ